MKRHPVEFPIREVLLAAAGLLAAAIFPTLCLAEEQPAAASELPSAGPAKQHRNRLADETSPYLLLHAHNPVDWHPWDEEALAKAKRENKPIFLSIGYSSCHWCHVMERESFLDEEIAKYLNEHFVCIKVDREERPDIDSIYMTALHVFNQLTRSGRGGGWPLSMFLTSDAKPFYGGTYFPARDGDRGARVGFLTILQKVHQVWKNDADTIINDAETITTITKRELAGQRPNPLFAPDAALLEATVKALGEQYDEKYGGFGYEPANPLRPKFPEPSNLFFLVDRVKRQRAAGEDDAAALAMLVGTLEKMSLGGIYDHLGGGFHRYSVDRFWRIPHFEKMLYDNGQLASVYAEAHQLTGRDDFRRVAEGIADFVLRELRDEQGGFYAALDAESENEEGKFYRWTVEEVQQYLSDDEYSLFAAVYGLNRPPNFEGEYYAPQLRQPLAEIADQRGVTEAELDGQLAPIRAKLLAVRNRRPRPLTDAKILTSWNGLMIRGLADAGRILDRPDYTSAAEQAADFVLAELRTDDGRLLRTHTSGDARLNAYVDDYAFLVDGLLALYRASGEEKWLDAARLLTEKQIELFWDDETGGFFFTSGDHEQLIARGKNPVDGALPSGNSVSAENLLLLAGALPEPKYAERAKAAIRSVSGFFTQSPAAAPRMAAAMAALLRAEAAEIANGADGPEDAEKRIVGRTLDEWTKELAAADELGRVEAVRTLPLFGAQAAEPLQSALSDESASVRTWAATALGDLKTGDVKALEKLLEDESLGVRLAAAYAVLRQRPNEKALAVLTEGLAYRGRGAPIHAADFLGKLKAKEALPALREAAQSEDYHVKNASLRAIRQIEGDGGAD